MTLNNKNKSNVYSQQILKCFLNNEIVTNKILADEIGLSEKTIRTKINSINMMLEENNLGKIRKKPRIGMWLDANVHQKSKILTMVNSFDSEVVSNGKTRMVSALRIILKKSNSKRITSKDLADSLYLSTPTILKILDDCRDWLKIFNIDLKVIRNKGIEIVYTESSYRSALKMFIFTMDESHTIEENINYFLPGIDVTMMKRAILNTEKEWGFNLIDESFNEILIYCCIILWETMTNSKGTLKFSRKELNMISQYSEYHLAEKILQKINEYAHVEFSNEDIAFLAIQILCSKTTQYESSTNDAISMLNEYDANLREFVTRMIDVISNVTNIDLTKDEELRRGLLIHLKPTVFRLKYNRTANNELTGYIKNEYKQTFRVSWLVSVLFEQYFNLKITEDELSFITIYIQSALDRVSKPVSVLLVSDASNGINQMICDKLKRNCREVDTIHIRAMHDFDVLKCKENLILCTKGMNVKDNRIVEIDDWLSEQALNKVKEKIQQLKATDYEKGFHFDASCHELFEPDLLFVHLHAKDKKEVLKTLNKELLNKGYVTKKYINTVFDREAATPTSIGNGIAIPHGDPNEVNTAKIVLATLDEPILWDTEQVDVIFLLVVKFNNEFEINRIQLFYKQYIKLVNTDEKVDKLRRFNTNIDLYRYLIG